jgi:hypothetical protein
MKLQKKKYKGEKKQIGNKRLEYQQLNTRIRNLTRAYLIHKQHTQFILLEKYCLQRDQLKKQWKQNSTQ